MRLNPHVVSARVLAGAWYLDQNVVDWRNLIDPEFLDLANTEQCILGQALGDFWVALKRLGLSEDQSAKLGFYLKGREDDSASGNANWSLLTETWLAYLADEPMLVKPSQMVPKGVR